MIETRGWSWVQVINKVWDQMTRIEGITKQPLDCRTPEMLYAPAIGEALIRMQGPAVRKMTPKPKEIAEAYARAAGMSPAGQIALSFMLNAMEFFIGVGDKVAAMFAGANGDEFVASAACQSLRAQVMYVLTMSLEPIQRQTFQREFVWDAKKRASILNDDEIAAWCGFELELGTGIISAIMRAKQVLPDLTAEELSTALLRKYGVPVLVDDVEVFTCHYCNTGPCTCGGGKAPKRKVTWEQAAEEVRRRGPFDTERTMFNAYERANTARAGMSYGPFRAIVEMVAEGETAYVAHGQNLAGLKRQFGPLMLTQQRHWTEVINRLGKPDQERRAVASELADAIHWQWLSVFGTLSPTDALSTGLTYIDEWLATEEDQH